MKFWLLLFYSPFIFAIPPDNECITSGQHILKISGRKNGKADFSNVKLTLEPENGEVKKVGQKYCGFTIKNFYGTYCKPNITIDYAAFKVDDWNEEKYGYCLIYDTYAECVCKFYQCNSVRGILYETILNTYRLNLQTTHIGHNNESHLQPDDRTSLIKNCLLGTVEAAYKVNNVLKLDPSSVIQNTDAFTDHKKLFSQLYPNETVVNQLKEKEQSLMPKPPVPSNHNASGGGGFFGSFGSSNGGSGGTNWLVVGITIGGSVVGVIFLGLIIWLVIRVIKRRNQDKIAHDAAAWLEMITQPEDIIGTIIAKYKAIRAKYTLNKKPAYPHSKNTHRYNDIVCFEETRVKIDDPNFLYHANTITLSDGTRVIAAQGPMPQTCADFWKMVVSSKSDAILMLCQFVEGNKSKCAPYFGPRENDTLKFGDYEVTTKSVAPVEMTAYNIRTIIVKHPGGTHEVKHVEFFEWADHCVPENLKMFMLMQDVIDLKAELLTVHCSAGVGRTGTAIAYLEAEAMLQKENKVDLYEVFRHMREQRDTMVQTEGQFVSIHVIFIERLAKLKMISRDSNGYKKFVQANKKYVESAKKEEVI